MPEQGKEVGARTSGRLRKARLFAKEVEEIFSSVPDRAAPSLARDALIAAINPGNGKLWNNATFVVPGALLVELAHEGRLDLSGAGKQARVTLRDPTPFGDVELDDALLTIGGGVFGQKVTRLVPVLPQTDRLAKRLVADGVIVEESDRRLGMFTVRRYHPSPSAGRDEVVARLRSALLGESVPDERTALLISVLSLGIHLKLFVPKTSVKEAEGRAEEILQHIGQDERALVSAVHAVLSREHSAS